MKHPLAIVVALATSACCTAAEYHVAVTGDNANDGSARKPLKTIQRAADLAQPGDTVTVHDGTYRERVNPPRGGTSDAKRITYQAAPGGRVVITGAEPMQGWTKVGGDTWKLEIPKEFFGDFNPFAERIQGEWCGNPVPRPGRDKDDWMGDTGRHAGSVYLNGHWLTEVAALAPVLKPAGKTGLWFANSPGADSDADLFAIKSIAINGNRIAAHTFSAKHGELHATPVTDGPDRCVGWIRDGHWLAFDKVNFGQAADDTKINVEITAGALADGGNVELRLDAPDGDLLGTCRITHTGDWRKWGAFSILINPVRGTRSLYLVFKSGLPEGSGTTIWAQFPGVNPNSANVEISVRQSVFYPSKPGINYITVRGFELRQAATPWAGAMSEQIGLIGTHWSKGWIIENNHIHHSMCTGVTLGRYELPENEFPPATAPGFVKSIELALRDGWSKENIGSHIVRNNRISHCEKNAIHGSLGSPFCEISGNDIHDIARTGWVHGPDTAGIKFLGGVDMVIRDNHIYLCGGSAGIWLDWMAQGTIVTGNLLHDNAQDIFFEMQHGPLVSANNILLSKNSQLINSEGLALVHNLIAGATRNISDPRATPFHPAHALTIAGLFTACGGDHRVHNNIFAGDWNILGKLPNIGSGNVFVGTAKPLPFDTFPVTAPGFNPPIKLIQKADGWYLTLNADPAWRAAAQRKIITTELLGEAKASGCAYENTDGTPLAIATDYFGKKRDVANPFPGPFEIPGAGQQTIKVWPRSP